MQQFKNRSDLMLIGLVRLLKVYFFFISIMLIFRLVFVFYFGESGHLENYQSDLLKAFFIGWKYDTLVSSFIILPLFLILNLIVPLKNITFYNFVSWFKRIYFFLMAILIPVILISDLGFYSFFQDHINILIFGVFEDDTEALFRSIWENYPLGYALVGYTFFTIFVFWLSKKFFSKVDKKKSFLNGGFFKYMFMVLVSFILLAGGIRGGYGELVLAPKYSDFSESEFINQVAMNGVYALEKTIQLRKESNKKDFNMTEAMGYGNNIHKAFSEFLGIDVGPTKKEHLINLIKRKTSENSILEKSKYNVVVFVMESFGSHWNQYDSETFSILGDLKKHFDEDYYFKNFISSENGTIGSLMAIASNIPPRPGKRFLSESKYMQVPLNSAAHVPYLNQGYETTFIYGGKLGWRDIGKYFKFQKYHNLIGENAIKKSLNLSGVQGTEWGLYDEHFFQYVLNKLKESKRPNFILGLSTSNHPPFKVPSSYEMKAIEIPEALRGRISREEELFVQRFQAFQYANAKLADFIENVKQSELAKNTIIAVTGDHNFWGFMNYNNEEVFSKYKVPFYLYLPEEIRVESYNANKMGSHEDIMRTIYNVSLSDTEYLSFGEDLFSKEESFAINGTVYANEDGLVYKGKEYSWKKIPLSGKKLESKKLKRLKSRFRSSMAISDFYLEETFKEFKSK